METRPLPANVTSRSSSLSRALTHALLLSLLPVATASAQPPPYANVSVTHDRTEVECFGRRHRTCMTAPQGTVLEVVYIEGDRYNHRNSNWYWVLLPPDQWGRRVSGWIRGDDVEHVQPLDRASALQANVTETPAATDARNEPRATTTPTSVEAAPAPAARTLISDVIVNFEFDKSSLTDEAIQKLQSAVVTATSPGQRFAVALEGHADGIGREAYNDRLGSARAETVRRYLTEQLGIPAENITVVSYGEKNPVAPNKTREGRARNRRVELKAGKS
jgi:outer membrane protein OmpA-like peptidoglycan-associated protein